ncbi:MAG: hypothetical protein JWR26_2651, partial [Pedosphaera sp.]|nr:hypothetical protein [Pedosphaera sp.]
HKYPRWRWNRERGMEQGKNGSENRWGTAIFVPAASLFVGRSPTAGTPSGGAPSLLTSRSQPKSLAAPSASICEMASSSCDSQGWAELLHAFSMMRIATRLSGGTWRFAHGHHYLGWEDGGGIGRISRIFSFLEVLVHRSRCAKLRAARDTGTMEENAIPCKQGLLRGYRRQKCQLPE